MKLNIHTTHDRGFTLIETLIAIAVLMIAIAGPLTIANKALVTALYAKNQSVATYLALEEMELLKNTKDVTVYNTPSGTVDPLAWLNGFSSSCINSGQKCDLSIAAGYSIKTACPTNGCQLYITADGYDHTGTQTTPFSRYFYLTQIAPDDYQATVIVTWNEGTVSNAVTLNSEIVNAIR